jgi:hypothetical protein
VLLDPRRKSIWRGRYEKYLKLGKKTQSAEPQALEASWYLTLQALRLPHEELVLLVLLSSSQGLVIQSGSTARSPHLVSLQEALARQPTCSY